MTVATRTYYFPTVAWFDALRDVMNRDVETYRMLGFIDARIGIRVGADGELPAEASFVLTFGPYSCDDVAEAPADDAAPVDFTLSAPYGTWKEMIENIIENRGADLHHTLNYLHFGRIELAASDQLQADLFFRINSSFQRFFDGAADVDTRFVA